MVKFQKAGKLEKVHSALKITIDGYYAPRGDLVIGAAAVRDLLAGRTVEISRVEARGPGEIVITYGGVARVSTTGRAVVLHVCGSRYTSPLAQVRAVIEGTRAAALVSRMVDEPVIDADRVQAQSGRPIDEGLEKSFA